jgi:hypothetical protein
MRIWIRAQRIAETGEGEAHEVIRGPSVNRHSHQKPGDTATGIGTAMVHQVRVPSWLDVARGYTGPAGRPAVLTGADLDQLPLPSIKAIDVLAVLDAGAVDPVRLNRAYYVGSTLQHRRRPTCCCAKASPPPAGSP